MVVCATMVVEKSSEEVLRRINKNAFKERFLFIPDTKVLPASILQIL